jgi:release factor glutamine methyltransferase
MSAMPAKHLDLPTPCTVGDFIDAAETAIRASRHVELWKPWVARSDAEELVEIVLGREVAQEDVDIRLSAAQARRLRDLAARRVEGEPMTLLHGHIDFHGIRIEVRPGVFTPRLSSEYMATQAIARLRRRRGNPVLVDVACGVGPVALSAARAVPAAQVWGLDISPAACELGRHNARRLGLSNVTFKAGDLLAPLPERLYDGVDVMTIHPPYVGRALVRTLPAEIARFEPAHSLTDNSDDGLGLVRRLAAESPVFLRRGGWLLVEVSPDLARSVAAILRREGFADVQSLREGAGAVTRLVVGKNRS